MKMNDDVSRWVLRGWYELVEFDDVDFLGLYVWPDRPARLKGRAVC